MTRFAGCIAWIGLILMQSGCVFGPTAIRVSHTKYNEAIQTTREQQLLLNLVRLKYRNTPTFLELENISSQFQFDQSANAAATINEGPTRFNPDVLNVGWRMSYSERPTLTYTPLRGDEFARRMLSPLSLETIFLLSQSGWSVDRILRLTVQEINGLDNARSASGPTPEQAPSCEKFARVSRLLREFQQEGLARIAYETRLKTVSDPISAAKVGGEAVLAAAQEGYTFRASGDGKSYVLVVDKKVPVLRIAPESVESSRVKELVDLLGLEPGKNKYDVSMAIIDGTRPGAKRSLLAISTRSLVGAMFYLSQAVQVPQSHIDSGLVTLTKDADGQPFDWSEVMGDLMLVHCQRYQPRRSAVAVRYKGYWFFIDDADLSSKSTFSLLTQLFDLQAGKEASVAPVLTLQVGG